MARELIKFRDVEKRFKRDRYLDYSDLSECMVYSDNNSKNMFNFNRRGQLKLLLSEIRFLTCGVEIHHSPKEKYIFLYIGSGKGYHIPVLMDMYKKYDIEWHFFDPNGHCLELNNLAETNNKIKIHDTLFLEENINYYKNRSGKLLFVSDIRTDNNNIVTSKNVIFDNKLQNMIIKELKPSFSLLKGRLPFPDEFFESFEIPVGQTYLQPFNKPSSTEHRIFLGPNVVYKKVTKSDLSEYEEKFFYYNSVIRPRFKNDLLITRYTYEAYFRAEGNNSNEGVDVLKYISKVHGMMQD